MIGGVRKIYAEPSSKQVRSETYKLILLGAFISLKQICDS